MLHREHGRTGAGHLSPKSPRSEGGKKLGLMVAQREHRSRDGAISLEALVIAEGVV